MMRYRIDRIGFHAFQALTEQTSGQVIGVTSRGIFILLGSDQVIFVSGEVEMSPLTVTLDPGLKNWSSTGLQDIVRVDEKIISIGQNLVLTYVDAQIWKPPLPQSNLLPPISDVQDCLVEVARRLIEIKGDVGWVHCLAHLTGLESRPPSDEAKRIEGLIEELRLALSTGGLDQVKAAVKPFLGLGRGLTPSGDDLVIGLMLVLSRWPNLVKLNPDLASMIEGIVAESKERTTRISQAMIACAAQGYADERLVNALDGIILGHASPLECADLLASYGGSSGIDSLLGIAAVIL